MSRLTAMTMRSAQAAYDAMLPCEHAPKYSDDRVAEAARKYTDDPYLLMDLLGMGDLPLLDAAAKILAQVAPQQIREAIVECCLDRIESDLAASDRLECA